MFEPLNLRSSIRTKVVLMQMVTALTVLVLAAMAFLTLEVSTFKRTEFRELQALGRVIANNAAPVVAFEDPEAAAGILEGLTARPSIVRARIFRARGDILASFPAAARPEEPPFPAATAVEGIAEVKQGFQLVQLIRDREGAPIGVLLLEQDLRELHQRIWNSCAALAAVLVILGLLSLLVSLKVQGIVTRPILDLARVVDTVSQTRDHRLRARVWAQDELGHLVETFNTMLARIQTQDEQLAEHREHLERLVDHRTLQLTRANQELLVAKSRAEEFSLAKSAFLSNMSHELRTPLNAILGYTQLMAYDPGREPKDRRQLDMILRAGEHLLGLINDVLSVARIEAQQQVLTTAPFDARRFILGIEEMIRIRAKVKSLSLNVEVDPALQPVLLGDQGKLRQILVNLLGNAVKFTADGGVGLIVRCLPEHRVQFEVRDTGSGIPPAELPGLFNAFFQTGSGRKAKEGTGLGLFLSQALVRLMGGEIQVESQVDRGSRFSFDIHLPPGGELPAEEGSRPELPRLVPGQVSNRQLVVDDNPDNRDLLATVFAGLGLPCALAMDGLQGLQAWRESHPEVVWMDMRMPGMDGFEATRQIRAEEAATGCARTIILAVTASVFEQDRAAILECGCDDILIKPYRLRDLLRCLARHTGLRFEEGPASQVPALDASPEAMQASLARTPVQWRGSFQEALLIGETELARDMLEQLPPGTAALALGLRAYLDEFRLDELERLLQAAEKAR